MKTMKTFLSMAALALAGAVMTTGCSGSDGDSIADTPQPQQPTDTGKTVTLKTTVGLGGNGDTRAFGSGNAMDGGGAMTRALSIDEETHKGVKTFAVGETMALIYTTTSGATAKAVSKALTADDITGEGKSATFTFTLNDPDYTAAVRYIYPAAMAKEPVDANATIDDGGTVDFTKLATQDGQLATLGSTLDLATYDGAWTDGNLPGATLVNRLAILAVTAKNDCYTNDPNYPNGLNFTDSITSMTVSDGTHIYTVTRPAAEDPAAEGPLSEAAEGPVYVAILPTKNADIVATATVTKTKEQITYTYNYRKYLSGKTYAAGNGYPVSWRMTPLIDITGLTGDDFRVYQNMILTGTLGDAGATIYIWGNYELTLDEVTKGEGDVIIHINIADETKLKLKGTNRLSSICFDNYDGKTITIDKAADDGTLILATSDYSIVPLDAENVIINGGTVKAKNTCGGYHPAVWGNLTINGGNVYLAAPNGFLAVGGSITKGESVTIYGWWSENWVETTSPNFIFITTDNSSGDPNDDNNTYWNWGEE